MQKIAYPVVGLFCYETNKTTTCQNLCKKPAKKPTISLGLSADSDVIIIKCRPGASGVYRGYTHKAEYKTDEL